MIHRYLCLFGLFLICCTKILAVSPDLPVKECSPRRGLPRFSEKLKDGKPLCIAFLGGSITAMDGWRNLLMKYMQKTYPENQFREINAGLGGTGSELGAFRLERDVLSHKPDLVFVEFGVNDCGVKNESIIRSMEGIVRQIRKKAPDCDICFVYTLTTHLMPHLRLGRFYGSAAVMEKVADYYHLPSIFLGNDVLHLEKTGKLVIAATRNQALKISEIEIGTSEPPSDAPEGKIAFSRDGVHPYPDTGHLLYAKAIVRSFPEILSVHGQQQRLSLPAPLDMNNLENARLVEIPPAALKGNWVKIRDAKLGKHDFTTFVPSLWKGTPGAELSFKFKGNRVLVYDLLGPDNGILEISVDGVKRRIVRFDAHCSYYRLNSLELTGTIDPNVEHLVSITILPEKIDKLKILQPKMRDNLLRNPEKYTGSNWYIGAILINGKLTTTFE